MTDLDKLLGEVNAWLQSGFELVTLIHDAPSKIFEIVESGSGLRVILKLYPASRYTVEEVFSEQTLLSTLSGIGVPCIAPYSMLKPHGFEFMGGKYFGMVTYKAFGQSGGFDEGTPSVTFFWGQALKKLHDCPLHILGKVSCLHRYLEWLPAMKQHPDSPSATKLRRMFDELIAVTKPMLIPINKFEVVLCHGDAWPGNAVYQSEGCTLLDFEFAVAAPASLDIATFLWWVLGFDNGCERDGFWREFKRGYGESIDDRIGSDVLALIRLNELKSLVLLYNHVLLSRELVGGLERRVGRLVDLDPGYRNFLDAL